MSVLSPISLAQCPHAGNGVGSIPYPPRGPYQVVSFRVWAPHASAVSVKDSASAHSVALVAQGSTGYWCLDVPGVSVNQRYDYVIATPGFGTVTRRDPNARMVANARNGHSITYDPTVYVWHDQNFTPPPLNKLVIYEMDTGQFNAGPSGWGTFQSSISKLGEITGMGFNAVELLPVTQFAAIHGNSYGPTHQYAVDNDEYGGPDNLKAFVDACHQQGLAVILDLVHNHWGPFYTEIGLPYGGTWQVLFNSDSTAYSSDFGNVGPQGPITAVKVRYAGQPYSATVPIGDYSVLVLSRQ